MNRKETQYSLPNALDTHFLLLQGRKRKGLKMLMKSNFPEPILKLGFQKNLTVFVPEFKP